MSYPFLPAGKSGGSMLTNGTQGHILLTVSVVATGQVIVTYEVTAVSDRRAALILVVEIKK